MAAPTPTPASYTYESLLALYTSASQAHLLKFYPSLNPDEQASLLKQLSEIDVSRVNKIFAAAMKGEGGAGGTVGKDEEVKPLPAKACASIVPLRRLATEDGKPAPLTHSSIASTPSLLSTNTSSTATINSASGPISRASSPAPGPPPSHYANIGLTSISQNKTAVLLLAGGQGTRLGSSDPKGCYDIGLPSGKCLFQLQAERIRKLTMIAEEFREESRDGAGGKFAAMNGINGLNGVNGQANGYTNGHAHGNVNGHANGSSKHDKEEQIRIPWYVMTSGPTRKATEEFFKAKGYFGMREEDVIFFDQGVLPALSNDGKILLSNKSTVSVAPDGNGGVYAAMRQPLSIDPTRTVLSDMRSRGIQYIHAYCVDNCLVKVADPVFLGYCIEKGAETGAKVVRKEFPTESVGVLAQKGRGFAVVEYSELSKDKAEQRDPETGELAFRAANIANHFYTIDFLEKVESMEDSMAFHIARKKIPTVDMESGEPIKPEEPNGMKLEMFIFDVFPFTSDLGVLEVERQEEFSPLKNAPSAKSDNAQTSRRDLLAQQRRWILQAGGEVMDNAEIELGPLVTYAGEGLESIAGKMLCNSGVVETLSDFEKLEAK